MSKFFRGAISSSDSSDSESSINEPVAAVLQRPIVRDFAYPSDSDDEGPKRVVRAQKDKVYEELKEQIRIARNAKNIKDISKLLTVFEALSKIYEKTRAVILREGLTIPRFYIRYLSELEDFVNEQWEDKEGRKVMSKVNAKALASIRQKIRKYNRDFDAELGGYRDGPDPVGYSSGAAEDDDEEILEKEEARPIQNLVHKKELKKKFMPVESGEESEFESGSDGDEESQSSSESDIDLEGKHMEELRKFFLKKPEKKPKEAREKTEKRKGKVKEIESDDNQEAWKKVVHKDEAAKPLFDSKSEINGEIVIKKLNELNMVRGRKATNRKVHMRYLEELYKVSDENKLGVGILTKILLSIIAALFELNARVSDAMEYNSWLRTLETIEGLFNLLIEYSNVTLSLTITEEEEDFLDGNNGYKLNGSAVLLLKRLEDELTKIFQNTDSHSTEYVERLKGERSLCTLIEKAQNYVDSQRATGIVDQSDLIMIYILRIEHLYFRYSPNESEAEELMNNLCKVIYSVRGANLPRQRAMLCQIYHYALHDRWHKAKNLMLMSHLQALVDHSDASTQILYNRTICQLGLCAFRFGLIRESHQCLSEIHNTQRAKEILGQGIPMRQADKTAEQEIKERSLQVPYHMHINLELMECVYLICSMLLEIPTIACHEYDARRRLLSRTFHYQLKFSEKSPLIGPPENTREHVVAASRAMLKGDWSKCQGYIFNDKMNSKVWNLFRNSDTVRKMLTQRIQEETLRTYLLMYSTVYTTVHLSALSNLFQLDKQKIYAIISKMIIQEELSATLDEPTDSLIMHRVEPSRLQLLALAYTEKLTQLADSNDQMVEPRFGRTNYTGSGGSSWYSQRQGTTGDDKARRVQFSDRRQDNAQKRQAWGNIGNAGNRRKENKIRY